MKKITLHFLIFNLITLNVSSSHCSQSGTHSSTNLLKSWALWTWAAAAASGATVSFGWTAWQAHRNIDQAKKDDAEVFTPIEQAFEDDKEIPDELILSHPAGCAMRAGTRSTPEKPSRAKEAFMRAGASAKDAHEFERHLI